MDREQETAPAAHRLLSLGAVALVAATAALAFGRVFTGHAPTWKLVLVALVSVGLAALLERRSPLLAAGISAVGLLWMLGLLVFPETLFYGLPLGRTVAAIGNALSQVGHQAEVQVAPTPPLQPLFMAAVTAVWTAAFAAHALVIRSGSPLLAIVPPAALIAFAGLVLEDGPRPGYTALFILSVMALLFMDGLRRVRQWGPLRPWASGFGPSRALSTTTTRGARRVTVAAVAVALLLPGLLPGFGSGPIWDVAGGGAEATQIDPLVSVTASLKAHEPVDLFRVQSSRDSPPYWRWLALDDFDGVTWTSPDLDVERGDVMISGQTLPGNSLEPARIPPSTHTLTLAQRVTILRPPGKWLPMAYRPISVRLSSGGFRYDPETSAAVPTTELSSGSSYLVDSELTIPSYEQLNQVTDFSNPALARYKRLPADFPPILRRYARQLTKFAPTPLQKALTIQQFLTSSRFHYDTRVSGEHGNQALVNFLLDTHRGFCQQFASAMAVLLRAIGIPARVAVGFTQGTFDPTESSYVVTTENAHSWVEVNFPGYGWMPFEPTPGRDNPVTDAISTRPTFTPCPTGPSAVNNSKCNSVSSGSTSAGNGGAAPGGQTGGQQRDTAQPGNVPIGSLPKLNIGRLGPFNTSSGHSGQFWFLLILGILVVAALVLIPLGKVLARRVRVHRAGSPRDVALAAYDLFTSRAADVGLGRGRGETPWEYRARIRKEVQFSDGHLDRLTRIASRAAYSADELPQEAAAEASQAGRTAIREIRREVPLPRRLLGLWWPRV